MSAGLPALVLLALALAAMFAWFERTHPPARVIALVASLLGFRGLAGMSASFARLALIAAVILFVLAFVL